MRIQNILALTDFSTPAEHGLDRAATLAATLAMLAAQGDGVRLQAAQRSLQIFTESQRHLLDAGAEHGGPETAAPGTPGRARGVHSGQSRRGAARLLRYCLR